MFNCHTFPFDFFSKMRCVVLVQCYVCNATMGTPTISLLCVADRGGLAQLNGAKRTDYMLHDAWLFPTQLTTVIVVTTLVLYDQSSNELLSTAIQLSNQVCQ